MRTKEFAIRTEGAGLYDITERVHETLQESGVRSGIVVVYCPHTDAGVTISENADPNLQHDLMLGLDAAFPSRQEFRHFEGNAPAHLKNICVGSNCIVPFEDGRLLLGVWQGIFFCEFNREVRRQGADKRRFKVKILEDNTV